MANILYIILDVGGTPSPLEQGYADIMTSLGHTVTPMGSSQVFDSHVNSSDGVVFSPQSQTSPNVTWLSVSKNVLSIKSYRSRDIGICNTGNVASSQTDTLITDDTNPLATGFSNGPVSLFTSACSLQYMTSMASGYDAVSTGGGGDQIGIVEQGQLLRDGSPSPSRRVHFPSAEDAVFADSTAANVTLFTNAFNYTMFGAVGNQPGIFASPGYDNSATIPEGLLFTTNPVLAQDPFPAGVYSIDTPVTGVTIDSATGVVTIASPVIGPYSIDITLDNGELPNATTNISLTCVEATVSQFTHKKAMALFNFNSALNLGLDVSGFGRNAAATNITQSDVGGLTNAGTFNGSNSILDCSNLIADYAANTAFSQLLRFVPNTLSGAHVILSIGNSTGANSANNLTLWQNGADLRFHLRTTSEVITATLAGVFLSTSIAYDIDFTTGPNGWKVWVNDGTTETTANGAQIQSLADITGIDFWQYGDWTYSALPLDGAIKDAYLGDVEIDDATIAMKLGTSTGGVRALGALCELGWGQSNQESNATWDLAIDTDYTHVTGRVFQFRNDTSLIDDATNPLASVTPIPATAGQWLGRWRAIVPSLPYGMIGMVGNFANGNTDLDIDWAPPSGSDYTNFVAKANAMMATSKLNNLEALVAMIGENNADKGSTAVQVTGYIAAIMAAYETDVTGVLNTTPSLMRQIGGPLDNTAARDIVNTGISDWADTQANYFYAEIDSFAVLFDNYHINAATQRRCGTETVLDTYGIQFSLNSSVSGPIGTQTGTYECSVSFVDTVQSLPVSAINVANGAASNVLGSGKDFTFDVTPNLGTGQNTISINAGGLLDYYNVASAQSNILIVDYNVAGGANPIITGVSGHSSGETVTLTVTNTPPSSNVTFNGYEYSSVTDSAANTVTALCDLNGPLGVSASMTITDSIGTSANFPTTKQPQPSWQVVTLTTDSAGMPANSIFFGIPNLIVGDQITFLSIVGGEIINIDSEGILQAFLPSGLYSIPYIKLDSTANFLASAQDTIELTIANNTPDTKVLAPILGATPGATVYSIFDIDGQDAGTDCWITDGAGQLSNDGASWGISSIPFTATSQGRVECIAPASGQTAPFSLEVNGVDFTVNVTSGGPSQGTVTIPAVKNGGVLYLNQTFNVVVSNNNDNKSVIIETTATTDAVTGDLVISDPSIAIGLDCFVSYWQDSPTLALVEPSVTSV